MNLAVQILLKNALDYIAKEKLDEAEGLLKKALTLAPKNHELLRLMSVIAALKSQFSKALDLINQVIAIAPTDEVAHSNKGNILRALGRYEEALVSLNESIRLLPSYAEAYNNKANVLQDLCRFEEALVWYDKAITFDPHDVKVYCNKGNALEWLGRHEEAMDNFDKATSINPQHVDAYWQKAMNQLASGRFELGWQNYEARWFKSNPVVSPQYQEMPRLISVDNLEGKRVLVWSEQGLGDTIQFCRYIKLLWRRGAIITFIVPQSLVEIFQSLRKFCVIVSGEQGCDDSFEFQTPLMSLPLLFKTTISSIPSDVPYLFAPKVADAPLSNLIGRSSNLRVGLVWSGGYRAIHTSGYADFQRRNIPLEQIAILKDLKNIDFYSLQKGDPAESELVAKKDTLWPDMANCAYLIKDFTDTAALIESMDLIISVDTSTAHLAGALGKPVWILNRYDSCWRWLRGREDSPWYPTVKIYQQKNVGNWVEVLERVRVDLANLAQRHIKNANAE